MVYNITTNGGRDENSQMRSQFPINNSQNTGLPVEEPPSKKIEYPPFVDQVPGLSLALLAKSRKLKIFWWLVFFACTICGMWTIMLVITEYIQVPTATSITIKIVPSLELPAITVCPNTPDALNYEPLFNHIQARLPDINNETAVGLISFWLAGSGLIFIQPAFHFNETRLVELAEMFKIWSDGYDTQSFFHMIQTEYGYTCEQLFGDCEFNRKKRDCCKELFRPVWVPKLGMCYQTRRNLNQTGTNGWFSVLFKPPPSITSYMWNRTGHALNGQPELIVYVNDNFEHVAPSRSFHLYPDELNMLYLNARLVELQEHSQDCTNRIAEKDVSCIVNNWLTSNLLDPFNCTVPYLKVLGIPNNTKICDPLTIVKNYDMFASSGPNLEDRGCIPRCTKWKYGRTFTTRASKQQIGAEYYFKLHVGFDELQYEHVREISTISISGLISQVGGQLGLYLGLSIITLVQIVIYGVNMVVRFFYRLLRPLPVGPNVNKNEYTMYRVNDKGLHYGRTINSYV